MLTLLRNIFLIMAFLVSTSAYPQEADSLRKLIHNPPQDSADIKNMVALSMSLFHAGTFDSSLHIAIQARKLSEKIQYKKGIGISLLASGYAYKLQGAYEASLRDFNEALLIFEELNDNLNLGKSHSFLAQSYQSLGLQDKAIIHLEAAKTYIEQIDYLPGLAVIYLDIGRYHSEKANYDVALEYYLKSLKASEAIKAQSKISMALNNIAVVYERLKQYDKAADYFQRALELATSANLQDKRSLLLANLGGIYTQQGKLAEAESNVREALSIARQSGHKEYESNALRHMGALYAKLDDSKSADDYYRKSIAVAREISHRDALMNSLYDASEFFFRQHKFELSKRYATEALTLASMLKAKEYSKELFRLQAKIDSTQGNFKSAYQWNLKWANLNDSISNEQRAAKIIYLQSLLEKGQKSYAKAGTSMPIVKENRKSLASVTQPILLATATGIIAMLLVIVFMMSEKLKVKDAELLDIRNSMNTGVSENSLANSQEK
jgi:tetratricopeptide (TPR) repeat protein